MNPFLVGVGLLAVSGDASTVPQPPSNSQSAIERVSFADLDLLGQAGKATLQRRIRAAAHRVCEPMVLCHWQYCRARCSVIEAQ